MVGSPLVRVPSWRRALRLVVVGFLLVGALPAAGLVAPVADGAARSTTSRGTTAHAPTAGRGQPAPPTPPTPAAEATTDRRDSTPERRPLESSSDQSEKSNTDANAASGVTSTSSGGTPAPRSNDGNATLRDGTAPVTRAGDTVADVAVHPVVTDTRREREIETSQGPPTPDAAGETGESTSAATPTPDQSSRPERERATAPSEDGERAPLARLVPLDRGPIHATSGSFPVALGLGSIVGVGAFVVSRRATHGAITWVVGHTVDRSVTRMLADWLGRLLPVLGLAGYQRYEDDDPLEHETRAALYDRIQSDQGVYLSALSETTDTPLGTVRYHLKVLEFEGLVTRTTTNGRRRYYPADVEPELVDALLDDSAARAVLNELADGAASVGDLAEQVDRDPSTVTHHTTRLAEMGLVERERDGRTTRNRLTDEGRAAMRRARSRAQSADQAVPSSSVATN